ncbi:MAG: polysaccharide deacetylase family protein [Bacteroidota bacterium]|nr:polysaccharide deacetylase family protein [Bacteroidota bacterium]
MKFKHKIEKALSELLFKKTINLAEDKAFVTFTFDDAPLSAFVNGGDILKKHGLNGTYYISMSLLNREGYFTSSNLKNALEQGHELACHTFSHLHSFNTSGKRLYQDVLKNEEAFQQIFPHQPLLNYSFPFGEQTILSRRLTKNRFKSSRGITTGINRGKIDINNLKAIKLYESTNSIQSIRQELKDLKANGGWLIFYTHDVQNNFSEYGCSTEYFEEVVKSVLQLDIKCFNIKEGISYICE